MLSKDQIKRFDWDQAVEGADDDEMLYEGYLTILFKDGTTKYAYLDWVRSSDEEDFREGNIDALIRYERIYGEIFLVD